MLVVKVNRIDFLLLCFLYVQRRKVAAISCLGIYKQFHKEGEKLENYTKFKLKDNDELKALLEDKDNLFIVACNKCFKEFDTMDEPDLAEFEKLAEERRIGKV